MRRRSRCHARLQLVCGVLLSAPWRCLPLLLVAFVRGREPWASTSCRFSARMPGSPGAPPLRASRSADATAHADRTGLSGSCARKSGGMGERASGVGAYDHISRRCIFDGLRDLPALEPLIPFVRMFYGADGEYLFYDEATHTQFFRRRVVSRETRSCRRFLRLTFTERCARHTPPYARERTCSPFWMTRTSHARLNESSQLSVPFAAHWRNTPT